MRTYLLIFLSGMLSLNTSYVASAGICSALEQSAVHATHFGHHDHNHQYSDEHAHDGHVQGERVLDDLQVSTNESGQTTAGSDHHHHHVHPSFSSILPDILAVMPLSGSSPQVAAPHETYISVSRVLLERPPRTSLV